MTFEGNEGAGSTPASGIIPISVPSTKAGAGRAYLQAIGLAVAGAAIGRSALLQMPDGRRLHAGLNLIIATGALAEAWDALASVVSPLRYEQARRHLALAKLNPEGQQRLIKEVAAERAEFVATDSMLAEQELAYFDRQLVELSGVSKPMLLLENPPPGRLTLAIGKSAGTALLALYDDLSLTALLNAARSTRGAMDLELLAKSWRQEIFDAPYLEGISDAAVVSPVVSMIAVAQPETVAKLLSSTEPLVAGFADCCMVVYDSKDASTCGNPLSLNTAVANWQQIVGRLLASRAEPTRIIGLSPEAGEVLARFREEVAEGHRNVPAADALQAPRAYERSLDHLPWMAGKMSLIQHVSRDGGDGVVAGDDARQAAAMADLARKHRLAILEAGRAEPATRVLREAVRAKIVAFGPLLSPRDIRRHFHALKTETLMPVLHDLVQADEIVKEQDGTYSARTPPQLQIVSG